MPSNPRPETLRLAVVVTDVSTEPGLGVAARLALEGHVVLVGSPDVSISERVAEEFRGRGADVFGAWLDLRVAASIHQFVQMSKYLAGPIDALIFGAAHDRGPDEPVPDSGDDEAGAQHLTALLADESRSRGMFSVRFETSGGGTCVRVRDYKIFLRALETWAAVRAAEALGADAGKTFSDPSVNERMAPVTVASCPRAARLQRVLDEWQRTNSAAHWPLPKESRDRRTEAREESAVGRYLVDTIGPVP